MVDFYEKFRNASADVQDELLKQLSSLKKEREQAKGFIRKYIRPFMPYGLSFIAGGLIGFCAGAFLF